MRSVPQELLLRHGHLYVVFYENFAGRCYTARVLCVSCARSVILIKHGTSTSIQLRRVLFVLLTDMSIRCRMLPNNTMSKMTTVNGVHCVDGGWLRLGAKSSSTVTMEDLFPFRNEQSPKGPWARCQHVC